MSVEAGKAKRFVVEELCTGCSRVVDRLQLRPVCLDECVGVLNQLGDELHGDTETSANANDRKAVGVTGEVAVRGLVRSGATDSEQPCCFGHREDLRGRVDRTASCAGLSACIDIRPAVAPMRTDSTEISKLELARELGWPVKAASAKPLRPEGLALTGRLVGIIAAVRPQADLIAVGRKSSTGWTFSEVLRNLQLCGFLLRFLPVMFSRFLRLAIAVK